MLHYVAYILNALTDISNTWLKEMVMETYKGKEMPHTKGKQDTHCDICLDLFWSTTIWQGSVVVLEVNMK